MKAWIVKVKVFQPEGFVSVEITSSMPSHILSPAFLVNTQVGETQLNQAVRLSLLHLLAMILIVVLGLFIKSLL